jgi:hypothetical protein
MQASRAYQAFRHRVRKGREDRKACTAGRQAAQSRQA